MTSVTTCIFPLVLLEHASNFQPASFAQSYGTTDAVHPLLMENVAIEALLDMLDTKMLAMEPDAYGTVSERPENCWYIFYVGTRMYGHALTHLKTRLLLKEDSFKRRSIQHLRPNKYFKNLHVLLIYDEHTTFSIYYFLHIVGLWLR